MQQLQHNPREPSLLQHTVQPEGTQFTVNVKRLKVSPYAHVNGAVSSRWTTEAREVLWNEHVTNAFLLTRKNNFNARVLESLFGEHASPTRTTAFICPYTEPRYIKCFALCCACA